MARASLTSEYCLTAIVMMTLLLTANALLEEPGCNRFQFQEKVLEKMVVLDHTMKVTLSDLEAKLTKYEKENLKLKEDLELLQEKVLESAKESSEVLAKELSDFQDNYRQQMTSAQTEHQKQFSVRLEQIRTNFTGEVAILEAELKKTINGSSNTSLDKPVAFIAYLGPSDINPVVGTAIVFNQEVQNYGNAYSTSDGMFTPPIAGVYHFSAQICVSLKDRVGIQILSETRIYAAATYQEEYDATCYSVSTVAVLERDEKVWVKCIVHGDNESSNKAIEADTPTNFRTMFNGFLVHPVA